VNNTETKKASIMK